MQMEDIMAFDYRPSHPTSDGRESDRESRSEGKTNLSLVVSSYSCPDLTVSKAQHTHSCVSIPSAIVVSRKKVNSESRSRRRLHSLPAPDEMNSLFLSFFLIHRSIHYLFYSLFPLPFPLHFRALLYVCMSFLLLLCVTWTPSVSLPIN